MGAGVYVSPYLEYAAGQYGTTVTLKAKHDAADVRKYAMVFQCVVKPGTKICTGYTGADNGWGRNAELKNIFTERL